MEKYTNELIHESSLYLQQHAHNPVNWLPWSEKAFEMAAAENKLILVSVGYSACHWCHVMEHECFEDEEVAALMNRFFVCIKVDREERPDVDQVYMNAVQLMTQRGGWPLNCFTLPDGRPVYGGTYFPKEQWMHVLRSLEHTFVNEPGKFYEYAERLTEGIAGSEVITAPVQVGELPEDKLPELVRRWSQRMDRMEGGPSHAPKFPLPNNYQFLLHYSYWKENDDLQRHVRLTLDKMLRGGIYDQLGGGFARYSVDMLWKVPHFEKMLYDNGQLLSLYAQAWIFTEDPEYRRMLEQTLRWLEREMSHPEGGLYAAQDADSEGEEGKYYVWTPDEIRSVLGKDADWYLKLYNPDNKGFWEHDQWILLRDVSLEAFCTQHPGLTPERITACNDRLFEARLHRVAPAPGTDTKCLTAWNAMTITGLIDAWNATQEREFFLLALKTGRWLRNFQMNGDRLWHTRQNGKSFIDGFLDDYAFTIEAFVKLYEATADGDWLEHAQQLLKHVRKRFRDEVSGMYFFTPEDHQLIARKMELNDNVIPSTNSVMANNLFTLSVLLEDETLLAEAKQMLHNVMDGMEHYGSGYSNWAMLLQRMLCPSWCLHAHGEMNEHVRMKIGKTLSPQLTVRYQPEIAAPGFVLCGAGRCSPKFDELEEWTTYKM